MKRISISFRYYAPSNGSLIPVQASAACPFFSFGVGSHSTDLTNYINSCSNAMIFFRPDVARLSASRAVCGERRVRQRFPLTKQRPPKYHKHYCGLSVNWYHKNHQDQYCIETQRRLWSPSNSPIRSQCQQYLQTLPF